MSSNRATVAHRLAVAVVTVVMLLGKTGLAAAQSAEEVAKANNPLAPIAAINFQNYAIPWMYGVDDPHANSLLLRPVIATERFIFRYFLEKDLEHAQPSETP